MPKTREELEVKEKRKATLLGFHGSLGKSTCTVQCSCEYRNTFYVWSWAGHGKARCAKCGCWIGYRNLDVVDPLQKSEQEIEDNPTRN